MAAQQLGRMVADVASPAPDRPQWLCSSRPGRAGRLVRTHPPRCHYQGLAEWRALGRGRWPLLGLPRCLQVLQAAEADAAARLARLQATRALDPSDWWAALNHAASRLPAGRVAQRLFDRIRLLPLSHHHRFPIYEQVRRAAPLLATHVCTLRQGCRHLAASAGHACAQQGCSACDPARRALASYRCEWPPAGSCQPPPLQYHRQLQGHGDAWLRTCMRRTGCPPPYLLLLVRQVAGSALQRDQQASASDLRVPPRMITHNAESMAQLEQYFMEFDPDELLPQASPARPPARLLAALACASRPRAMPQQQRRWDELLLLAGCPGLATDPRATC